MRPAKLAVQKAVFARLSSALTEPVRTDGDEVPGVEIGRDDEAFESESTTTEASNVTVTVFSRAFNEVQAKELSDTVVTELTDRADLLSLDAPFYVLRSTLIGSDMQTVRRVDGPTIYENIDLIEMRVHR